MQKLKLFRCLLYFFLLAACHSEADKRLAYALELAGENRPELEKVLEHYAKDSLKLKAAQFLISNMPGQVGHDSALIQQLQPVYDKHVAISETYDWKRPVGWQKEINKLWERETIDISRYPMKQDVNTVKAGWLIKEIDLAFKTWQENDYTKDAPFDDFCRYILPYRFCDKFILDSNRQELYNRHHGLFNDKTKNFRTITDSLHFLYSSISHSAGTAASMPICTISAYEQLKRGVCEDQTRFNAHLMSALGMAVVTDFVPGWGNRTNGHGWNALIIDGKTYPFEPFWDKERWKYDRIYNNETFDLQYGRFRLPKVFRHTFEYYLEGPMADEKENRENIPGLFKNPRKRDVSSHYFKVSDVIVELTEMKPDNTNYCYLCVYDAKGMTWTPVQWSKVEGNQALFKDMGRDIVYLPAFYQDGTVIPAASAFILGQNGKCEKIKRNGKTQEIVVNATTPLGLQYGSLLNGVRLTGCNSLTDAKQQELLYKLSDTVDIDDNDFRLHPEKEYQYVRLEVGRDTIALNEISFYEEQKGNPVRIPDIKVLPAPYTHSFEGMEKMERMTDYLSGTGCFASNRTGRSGKKDIVFDLGKQYALYSFSVIPFPEFHLNGDRNYTLYYWDNEWKPVEKVKGSDDFVSFGQVPADALYLIKCSVPVEGTYSNERIFTYKDGMLTWW